MQIQSRIKLGKPQNDFEKALEDEIVKYTVELAKLLNSGIKFEDNHNLQKITMTTNAVADTEDTVAHSLGRVPVGYLVVKRNKAGVVYDGSTAWTASNLYIKCNVASVAITLYVF